MWHIGLSPLDRLVVRLVRVERRRIVGRLAHVLLCARGTDIDPRATIGPGLRLPHSGIGVVVHGRSVVGANVTLYQGVTIGRADMWQESAPDFRAPIVEDEVVVCAGAVVVAGDREVRVGRGAVIGANAVVARSVPAGEIWAGSPARKVGVRNAVRRS